MKILQMLFITTMLASCASSEFGKRKAMQDEINENLIKEDRLIGEMPSWVNGEGINGVFVYAVGEAEYSASQRVQLIKSAAEHNAKMRIASRLPSDYTYIAQNALSSASNGEFNQVEINRGDLYGLQGVEVKRKYTACAKIVRHTDFGESINRICWAQASVPVKQLNNAIVRTIKLKYGEETGSKFEKLLEQQLQNQMTGGYNVERPKTDRNQTRFSTAQDNNTSSLATTGSRSQAYDQTINNESMQRRTEVSTPRIAKGN